MAMSHAAGAATALFLSVVVLIVHDGPLAPTKTSLAQTTGKKPPPDAKSDETSLPKGVADMVEALRSAIRSGEIEEMRTALELNEMRPEIAAERLEDPIAYWRRISGDGEGRQVLAEIALILDAGFARTTFKAASAPRARKSAGASAAEMYVWPYLAELDLKQLTPAQDADLRRLVPPKEAAAMKATGRYTHWRLGIASDGTWHYLIKLDK